jgi:hypothetical protein
MNGHLQARADRHRRLLLGRRDRNAMRAGCAGHGRHVASFLEPNGRGPPPKRHTGVEVGFSPVATNADMTTDSPTGSARSTRPGRGCAADGDHCSRAVVAARHHSSHRAALHDVSPQDKTCLTAGCVHAAIIRRLANSGGDTNRPVCFAVRAATSTFQLRRPSGWAAHYVPRHPRRLHS